MSILGSIARIPPPRYRYGAHRNNNSPCPTSARTARAERVARARCAQPGDACPIGRRLSGPRCPPATALAGAIVPERRDGWFSAGASLQLLPPSVIGWPPHILASAIDGLSPQAPSARFSAARGSWLSVYRRCDLLPPGLIVISPILL